MKIYTKTGDTGLTGLAGGTRVSKADIRLEAYGTIDELNSFIGTLMTYAEVVSQYNVLEKVQHRLFNVGAHLATDTTVKERNERSIISDSDIAQLEQEIDNMNSILPELRAFILPGGTNATGFCHICRTVTRRAERRMVEMNAVYPFDTKLIIYVNRLSDYFFTLARFVTISSGEKEILWKHID